MEILLVIICIVLIWLWVDRFRNRSPKVAYQYHTNNGLFSAAELAFLKVLDAAIGEDYRIFGKVRIADVINVNAKSRSDWQIGFNQICAKHFDYVLCDKVSYQIIAAIELDDASHQEAQRQQRDALIVQICNEARLPLIQIQASRTYNQQVLREIIQLKISGEALSETNVFDIKAQNAPHCPQCASKMMLRKAKQGKNSGNLFWGCPNFPDCKGTAKF